MMALLLCLVLQAKETEEQYYPMIKFPIPPGVVLEAGGIELMPDGRIAVATRRGDIYMVENAFTNPLKDEKFSLWAGGLHEVLGLAYRDGWLYCQQRGELTRIKDADGDGRAETFRTVSDAYEVNGDYHPFRVGFGSGNVPSIMTPDGSLWAGGTSRGWGSRGSAQGALDRVVWSGKVPFEVLEMRAKPDGFELVFTKPADKATASKVETYAMKTWTYIFQSQYGSPEVDHTTPVVKSVTLSDDGLRARLVVDGLQVGHVHELKMPALRSADGRPLLHDTAYYTLWQLP